MVDRYEANWRRSQQRYAGRIQAVVAIDFATKAARDAFTGLSEPDIGIISQQVDDNTYWILVSTAPIKWVPFADGSSVGNGNGGFMWGAASIASSTTSRHLYPGYENTIAQVSLLQIPVPRPGTARNLFVHHNDPKGNGNPIDYTLIKEGAPTALTAQLISTAASASNVADSVDFAQGEKMGILVTKGVSIGNGGLDVTVTVEFA